MISSEEKKVILRRKPLPVYYASIRDMFPSVYMFIKRDLFASLKKNDDVNENVIYDYKNDNIWITREYFLKYETIFIGYIQDNTFEKYKNVILAQAELTEQLYNRYVSIRELSWQELNLKLKQFKGSSGQEEIMMYEYCYYDRMSRLLPIKLINKCLYFFKYAPREKYQQKGRQKILDSK